MAVSVGLLLYCNCRLQWCFLLMDMLLNKTARETNLVLISTRFRKKVFCSRKQLWHIVPAGIFTEWIRWIVTIIIFSRYMLPTCIWDFWTETRCNLSLSVRRNLQLDLCTTEGKAFEHERSHVRLNSCCSISCLSDRCLTVSRVHVTPHHVTHYSCFMIILLMHILM